MHAEWFHVMQYIVVEDDDDDDGLCGVFRDWLLLGRSGFVSIIVKRWTSLSNIKELN